MSFVNLLKTSLYSIKAHKLRMFLTMIGIIIGISSTVTMKSIGDGLEHYMISSMETSGSDKYRAYFKSNSENGMMQGNMISRFDQSDIDEMLTIDGVTDTESANSVESQTSMIGNTSFFGKNIDIYYYVYDGQKPDMECGEWFRKENDSKKQVVLNYDNAKDLFSDVNQAIGKGVTINGEMYEVIGVTQKTKSLFDLSFIYSFISKNNIIGDDIETGEIDSISFKVKPGYDLDEVFGKVKDLLNKNHPGSDGEYEVYDPSQNIQMLSSVIGGLTAFVTAITGIALFVGGVGVMNIMYVSVTERKREIGIRRAIGAKQSSIMLQFLLEAVIVTGIGGIIGIALGAAIGNIASGFIPIEGFKAVVTAKTLIGAASVSILVGIIFGIVPAKNAAKLDPIKAIYQ